MKFKIVKRDFLKSLEKTLSVVERRNTMPSLNHTLLELKDGKLTVSATDLEIFVSSQIECQMEEEGRVAIPARNLYEIIRECPTDTAIGIHLVEGNRIEIQSGRSQFRLLGLAADSFPHFKTSPRGQLSSGKLKVDQLLELIKKTEHCICTEEYRYALTGIYLENIAKDGVNHLRAVSTDGHRLAIIEKTETEIGNFALGKGIIIPRKGCIELRKLLETSQENEVQVECDENLLRISTDVNKLWIRPIDSEYPDYNRVIPESLEAEVFIKSKELSGSLKRMNLLVSDRSRVVTFDFYKDHLKLSTQNPDLGEAKDEVPAEYTGSGLKTGFNVKFFIDALNNIKGDSLSVHVGEKLQPALLESKDDPGYRIVIMPMRL